MFNDAPEQNDVSLTAGSTFSMMRGKFHMLHKRFYCSRPKHSPETGFDGLESEADNQKDF